MSVEGGFITKEPAEAYPLTVPFDQRLPSGATIQSATISATDTADASDATSTVIADPSATISGTGVIFGVQAGTNGSRYRIKILVDLDTTPGTLIDYIDMLVRDTS